jgi:putative ABC transport system permease protein
MQAVLGATVAARTGLGVGTRFVGSHGLAEGGPVHGDSVYTVVGVLQSTGTVLDRLVLVNLDSIWFAHEGNITDPDERKVIQDERQVTVLLVQYATPQPPYRCRARSMPRQHAGRVASLRDGACT